MTAAVGSWGWVLVFSASVELAAKAAGLSGLSGLSFQETCGFPVRDLGGLIHSVWPPPKI
jgi:hypothetical protein